MQISAPPVDVSFKGCRVYRTSNVLSMTSGFETTVGFDNEEQDTDGFHDNSTNNMRITIPSKYENSLVQLFAGFDFGSSTNAGSRMIRILKQDASGMGHWYPTAAVSCFQPYQPNSFEDIVQTFTPVIRVSATDYFYVNVWHDYGSAISAGNSSWFMLRVVEE